MNTWFSDPEGGALVFTSGGTTSLFTHSVVANELTLDFGEFQSGTEVFTVEADDGVSTPTEVTITVTLNDTPDGPRVITALDPFPVTGDEDTVISQDMSVVFSDPDGDAMIYQVTRLGTLINPTASQIQNHELVEVIEFVGNNMQITLQENQHGSVEITLEADDQDPATPNASHDFLLTVNSEPDFPVANDDPEPGLEDVYKVPLGSQLQITNLSEGLLGNDYDPDGDTITYNGPAVVTTTNSATVQVNPDGTFTYNFGPNLALLSIGDTDTFTYTIVDSTGRESDTINPATVTITYEASAYQNPIAGLREDVNADGFVTPLDALVVINFLEAQGSASVPVSLIGSAPPDYLDTTGNGLVTPQDALDVIDVLALLGGGSGEGEFASQLRTQQIPAQLGTTMSFAAVNRSGLPIRDRAGHRSSIRLG